MGGRADELDAALEDRGDLFAVEPAGEGVRVRVIAGRHGDTVGPVSGIAIDPLYLDVELAPGARAAATIPAATPPTSPA